MRFDLDSILAGIVGREMSGFLFFASALWVGSMIGGIALMAPGFVRLDFQWFVYLPLSPVLLCNVWIIPNAALLGLMWVWHLMNDGLGYVAWGVLVGMESGFAMLGFGPGLRGPMDAAVAFGCWLVLLVMVETGVWLLCHWRRNIWARHLFDLSVEKAMSRAERDSIGTGGNPPDESEADTDLNRGAGRATFRR